MDRQQMIDLVAEAWPRDRADTYEIGRRGTWDVVTLRSGKSSREAVLEWGEDELYCLQVARCVLVEFAYEEPEKFEVLRDQLVRAREYVDGIARLVEVSLRHRVIRQTVTFADGDMAVWRLPLAECVGTLVRVGLRRPIEDERRPLTCMY